MPPCAPELRRRIPTSICLDRDVFAASVLYADAIGLNLSRFLEAAAVAVLRARGVALSRDRFPPDEDLL